MKKLILYGALVLGVLIAGSWWFLQTTTGTRRLQRLAQQQKGFGGKALVISLKAGSQVVVINTLKGDDLQQELIEKNYLSPQGTLLDNRVIIFNGISIASNNDLTAIATLMFANPYRVFYVMGPPIDLQDKQWLVEVHDSATRSFFETMPLGIYLLAEDDNEAPLRISPTDNGFAKIACEPVTGKGPIRSVCSLGGVCSFEEGTLSGTVMGAQQKSNVIIDLATTLATSTISSQDTLPFGKERTP